MKDVHIIKEADLMEEEDNLNRRNVSKINWFHRQPLLLWWLCPWNEFYDVWWNKSIYHAFSYARQYKHTVLNLYCEIHNNFLRTLEHRPNSTLRISKNNAFGWFTAFFEIVAKLWSRMRKIDMRIHALAIYFSTWKLSAMMILILIVNVYNTCIISYLYVNRFFYFTFSILVGVLYFISTHEWCFYIHAA